MFVQVVGFQSQFTFRSPTLARASFQVSLRLWLIGFSSAAREFAFEIETFDGLGRP